MAGPTRLFQYFTDDELQNQVLPALKQEALTGTITSTGGAGKNAGLQVLPLDQRMQSFNLEMDIRGGVRIPQKVEQIIRDRCVGGNGATVNCCNDYGYGC